LVASILLGAANWAASAPARTRRPTPQPGRLSRVTVPRRPSSGGEKVWVVSPETERERREPPTVEGSPARPADTKTWGIQVEEGMPALSAATDQTPWPPREG